MSKTMPQPLDQYWSTLLSQHKVNFASCVMKTEPFSSTSPQQCLEMGPALTKPLESGTNLVFVGEYFQFPLKIPILWKQGMPSSSFLWIIHLINVSTMWHIHQLPTFHSQNLQWHTFCILWIFIECHLMKNRISERFIRRLSAGAFQQRFWDKQVVDQYWSKVCGVIFEIIR